MVSHRSALEGGVARDDTIFLTYKYTSWKYTSWPESLVTDLTARRHRLAEHINQRNLKFFDQEVQKLDAWAADLKVSLEQEIKDIDCQIKEVRRAASAAPTLEEKLHWQKQQRELEQKRNKLRRELFDRQDEVEAKRNGLIAQLEMQLKQQVQERTLYTIEWELP